MLTPALAALASIRLVAFDLDGTLLTPSHRVSTRTKLALQSLSARGVEMVIATGRSTPAVTDIAASLGLPRPLHCVVYNGGCCVTLPPSSGPAAAAPQQPEIIFEDTLTPDAAAAVLALAAAHSLATQYYVHEKIYVHCCEPSHDAHVATYKQLTGCAHTYVEPDYAEAVTAGRPHKMLVLTDDPDALCAAAAAAGLADAHGITVVRGSPPFFCEFLAGSKGNGLEKLCAYLGVDAATSVAAFGDGDNDREMLGAVKLGIAMANARDSVKRAADRVSALPNSEDGVAHELELLEAEGVFGELADGVGGKSY